MEAVREFFTCFLRQFRPMVVIVGLFGTLCFVMYRCYIKSGRKNMDIKSQLFVLALILSFVLGQPITVALCATIADVHSEAARIVAMALIVGIWAIIFSIGYIGIKQAESHEKKRRNNGTDI